MCITFELAQYVLGEFEYGLCPVKGRVCAYDAQSGGDRQFAAKDRIRKIRPMYDAEFFQ